MYFRAPLLSEWRDELPLELGLDGPKRVPFGRVLEHKLTPLDSCLLAGQELEQDQSGEDGVCCKPELGGRT